MIRNILARAFAVPTTSPLLTPHPFPARLHLFPLPTNQSAPTKPIGALKPWTCLNQSSVFGLPSCCEDVATHTLYSWPTRTSYLFTYDFDFDKICLTHLICISVQILSDYDPIESWSSECAVAFKCGMKKVDSIRQWLLRLPWYINFFFDLADLSHLHIKFRVCPRARVSLSLCVCVCVCVLPCCDSWWSTDSTCADCNRQVDRVSVFSLLLICFGFTWILVCYFLLLLPPAFISGCLPRISGENCYFVSLSQRKSASIFWPQRELRHE